MTDPFRRPIPQMPPEPRDPSLEDAPTDRVDPPTVDEPEPAPLAPLRDEPDDLADAWFLDDEGEVPPTLRRPAADTIAF